MAKKQIWKYVLIDSLGRYHTNHDIPQAAEFRHLAMQRETLCMWFEVDPSAPMENRRFMTVGTGHEFDDGDGLLEPLGSFLVDDGSFVFHVYEATMLDRAQEADHA